MVTIQTLLTNEVFFGKVVGFFVIRYAWAIHWSLLASKTGIETQRATFCMKMRHSAASRIDRTIL